MLIIKNAKIITLDEKNPFIEKGFIAIKNGSIEEVSSNPVPEKYKNYEVIDAKGKIVMPGFINTHHHAYSAFARGASFGGEINKNFTDILENVWWKIDRKLTLEDSLYSGYVTFIESVLNGVTTVIDHHASFGKIKGSLFSLAKAAQDVGIRASLCYEVSDRDGKKKFLESVKENVDFIKYTNKEKSKFLKGMFGLHASFTLSDESLKLCKKEEDKLGSGFHVHCAEDMDDVKDSIRKYGCRVIERFYNAGILGKKTIAVHGIHTNKIEHELLEETKTVIIHAPESNMCNAVGTAPLFKFFKNNVSVGLGTDGYTSDVLESLKVAMCLQKHEQVNSNIGFPEIPNMLLKTNREIVKRHFAIDTGILKKGAEADIIILDYKPYTPLNKNNIMGHTLFGLTGRQTNTVIIGGKVILKDREFVALDIEKIYKNSIDVSKKLWGRLNK